MFPFAFYLKSCEQWFKNLNLAWDFFEEEDVSMFTDYRFLNEYMEMDFRRNSFTILYI